MEVYSHITFKDNRGSYTPILTNVVGIDWTQCSISVNDSQFTFRGMHYQTNPPQTKYIKVVKGLIIDFALDLETGELHHSIIDENKSALIKNNFAHGFLTLEPNTIVAYMVEGEYNYNSEKSIPYHTVSELVSIIKKYCNLNEIVVSEKDQIGK
jgi:dTDP-4-dehydrorhamnose 3,5-epimerase